MFQGYKTHGFAVLLVLKGLLGLLGFQFDGEPVELKPVSTFENFDEQLQAASEKAGGRDQGGTDILLGGALSAMRSGMKREKKD